MSCNLGLHCDLLIPIILFELLQMALPVLHEALRQQHSVSGVEPCYPTWSHCCSLPKQSCLCRHDEQGHREGEGAAGLGAERAAGDGGPAGQARQDR